MLVSEIATRVKRQFGDEAGAQITDADIIRWVNDAQREIAVKNNLLQVKATSDSFVGQAEYAVPNNILTLHTVRYRGKKLNALSQQEADILVPDMTAVNNGTPQEFWIFGTTITLHPAPDSSSTGAIVILYTRTPVVVTLVTDTPELPQQYHNRIVEYCIAQAAELDDNMAQYQFKMGQFEAGVTELKDNAEWSERDFYPSITAGASDLTYSEFDFT